jgi:hypothetical protein
MAHLPGKSVALEEESAVENALRIDGEHRVGHHDEGPEDGVAADEAPFELGRKTVHAEPEQDGDEGKDGQDCSCRRSKSRGVPEAGAVEARIAQQLPERVAGDDPEQGQRGNTHWREPVRERQSDEDGQELE